MAQISPTKRALAESLKTLMRKQKFERITVEEICDCAGTTRRNFYRHFADKYELLTWIYDQYFCQYVTHYDTWTVLDYMPQICADLYQDMPFYDNAFNVEGQNSFRSFCTERLTPLFLHDFGDVFLSKEAAMFYIELVTNAVFDDFQKWFRSENPLPPEEYISHVRKSVGLVCRRMAEICEAEPAEPEKWK